MKIHKIIAFLFLLEYLTDKPTNCLLCRTLLECAAMGMEVIKPRYITNLMSKNDFNTYTTVFTFLVCMELYILEF